VALIGRVRVQEASQRRPVLLEALARVSTDHGRCSEVTKCALDGTLNIRGVDGPTLGCVALQQRRFGLPVKYQGKLPRQVLHVMDRRSKPEATCGWMLVGSIAADEHPPHLVLVGDDALDPPASDDVNVQRVVADPQTGLDLLKSPTMFGVRSGEADVPARRRHVLRWSPGLGDGVGEPDVAHHFHGAQVRDV